MSSIFVYQIKPFGKLKISNGALMKMCSYRQCNRNNPESGGFLLGRYIINCKDIVIDTITFPQNGDIQKRFFFQKNFKTHQCILKEIWKKSRSTCNYLGEWHTHPEGDPTPSSHDMLQWEKILRESKVSGDFIFFIIIGTRKIKIWQGFFKNLKIIELKQE